MSDSDDGEVHPLDQDYTQTISSEKRTFRVPQGNVLRAGVLFFLLGLVSLLVTAALLGIFSGARSLEAGGSVMHRVSGVLILVGGVLILIGYRIRAVNGRVRGRSVLGGGGSCSPLASWLGSVGLASARKRALLAIDVCTPFFRWTVVLSICGCLGARSCDGRCGHLLGNEGNSASWLVAGVLCGAAYGVCERLFVGSFWFCLFRLFAEIWCLGIRWCASSVDDAV